MQVPASRRIHLLPGEPVAAQESCTSYGSSAPLSGSAQHSAMAGAFRQAAEERRDSLSLAIAAGVADQVIDLGFVPMDDMPALYTAARLMVFPSLFEGFGIPLVEAMACGCPIAARTALPFPNVWAMPPCWSMPSSPRPLPRQLPVYGTIQSYGSRWRNGAACAHRATAGLRLSPNSSTWYGAGTPARRGSLEVKYG